MNKIIDFGKSKQGQINFLSHYPIDLLRLKAEKLGLTFKKMESAGTLKQSNSITNIKKCRKHSSIDLFFKMKR